MEKYKRIKRKIKHDDEIQVFLDELTTEGWKIIYYDENIISVNIMEITVLCSQIII